jgi:outer membrane protein, adhesin transport system
MKNKLLCFFLIVCAVPEILTGQKVYSLNECISLGLEKNFSILISRNSENIAKNNYSIGNAGFLPSLDLNSRHSGTLNNVTSRFTDGTQSTSGNVYNTTTTAGLAMGLTIFNGFNVQTTYRKLNELKEIGELNTQLAIENLVADIISGYYNYIQQIQMMRNLQYAVLLSRERLRIDEERYLLGSSSKLQVLQSRVYLNSDSTRLSKQAEVVRAAQVKLNEMMVVEDLGEKFVTEDTSINVNQELLYERLVDETLVKNTSLQIASRNRNVSEYDYKLVVSRSYPYLNMSSGYGYNYYTYSTGSTKYQLTNGLNYGLTFGINIFDGLNQRRSIQNSFLDLKNKELKYHEIEQGIRADLITLFSAYSNYLRLIVLEEQNLQTAAENLDIAMERYRLGNLSGLDLREVQKSLLDSRESLLTVQFQAKLAEISLLLISGEIMTYYR